MFKQNGNFYLYDANRNKILLISSEHFKQIQGYITDKPVDDMTFINKLISNGFLGPSRIQGIEHPMTDYISNYLDNKLAKLTLQVTQKCNFRCEYCSYSGAYENRVHSNENMTIDTAQKAIDFLFDHSSQSKQVNIGFYGGEPLLSFDLIKECVEYTEAKYIGKDVSFTMTTNGSLIDRKIIDFFIEHNISLSISVDGPKEIHNKNRKLANGCGSYETVHEKIRLIKEEYPEYYKEKVTFLMVLDPETNVGCLNQFCSSELFDDSIISSSFINDLNSKNDIRYSEDFTIGWEYEKFKFYLSKLGNLAESNASRLLSFEFQDLNDMFLKFEKDAMDMPAVVHHGGPCIPGQLRLFVTTSGDLFPCERVSESSVSMKIGHINSGFEYDKAARLLNIGKLSEDDCKSCFAIRLCSVCAAHADNITELSQQKKSLVCNSVRRGVIEKIKDGCALLELGYQFK